MPKISKCYLTIHVNDIKMQPHNSCRWYQNATSQFMSMISKYYLTIHVADIKMLPHNSCRWYQNVISQFMPMISKCYLKIHVDDIKMLSHNSCRWYQNATSQFMSMISKCYLTIHVDDIKMLSHNSCRWYPNATSQFMSMISKCYLTIYVCIYLISIARDGCDSKSTFSAKFNWFVFWVFFSPRLTTITRLKSPVCSIICPYLEENSRIHIFFLCEMQTAFSRIWTRIAVSIFNDDNHYITGTTIYFKFL